jgi:hypothetical protein
MSVLVIFLTITLQLGAGNTVTKSRIETYEFSNQSDCTTALVVLTKYSNASGSCMTPERADALRKAK